MFLKHWQAWNGQQNGKYWNCCSWGCWCCCRRFKIALVLNNRSLLNRRYLFFRIPTIHPFLRRHHWLVRFQRHQIIVELIKHVVAEEISFSFKLEGRIDFDRLHSLPQWSNFTWIIFFRSIYVEVVVDSVEL